MKDNSNTPGKTVVAVGIVAAVMLTVTYLVLPPTPPVGKPIDLQWEKNNVGTEYWYEFASTTDLAKSNNWYFKARVQDTNKIRFYMTNKQEFFAVRTAIIESTVRQPDGTIVTNWSYSEYSQISDANNN